MKRPLSHQIDKAAQKVFDDAIPDRWTANEQRHDYGKDYLTEICDPDDEMTGLHFFVQLKGQQRVRFTADRSQVVFSLKKKYAAYYLDKVTDLPVFLVVVDVSKQKGWYVFIQPILAKEASWRNQKSVTVYLPVENDIKDTAKLRRDIEAAKRKMWLMHPTAIEDAVAAEKERVHALDPRFHAKVAILNDKPYVQLCPEAEVPIQLQFPGEKDRGSPKLKDLFERGAQVHFKPGEILVKGSPLFERLEREGGAIQVSVKLDGTASFIAEGPDGQELGRMGPVPGRFRGGRKELWFEGGFERSPLRMKIGPLDESGRATVNLSINIEKWEGERLLHLPYFEKILPFFKHFSCAQAARLDFEIEGNHAFSAAANLPTGGSLAQLAGCLTLLDKARKVAKRFNVNPVWSIDRMDDDSVEAAEHLYAVFEKGGYKAKLPDMRVTMTCVKRVADFSSIVEQMRKPPNQIKISSHWIYDMLGEKLETGRLGSVYSNVTVDVQPSPTDPDALQVTFEGTDDTTLEIQQEEE